VVLRKRNWALPKGRTAFGGMLVLLAGLSLAPAANAQANKATWFPGFSTIVVDAKTGELINAAKADELRHPASLAKVMTLYLLFSELESGRLRLNSPIKISAEATAQPPSKLGLKVGQTIEVEDAIKALVTRSANDIAVAIAEIIAGDEDSFAKLMTRRARALGMTRTVFKNASGLPDPEQVTTAREMALLGLAIQERFPKYYPYFSTRAFHWQGAAIGNHNRLLGTVDGVDGIKTGYTSASGFNLITNVKRNNRHIVAVVLGGRTGAARDELMRDLVNENIKLASAGPRTTPRFAEKAAPAVAQDTPAVATPTPVTTASVAPAQPAPGSREPVRRTTVQVVPVDKDGARGTVRVKTASVLPISTMSPGSVREAVTITPMALAPEGKVVTFAPPPAPSSEPVASAQDSPEIERAKVVSALISEPKDTSAPAPQSRASSAPIPEPKVSMALMPEQTPEPLAHMSAESTARGAWYIQIGAYAKEEQARERLADARVRAASILAKSSPVAEKWGKGKTEIYRARFAGFDEASAKRACETLRKSDFACFAAKN
jgi:D-alanyl-D-alanine carboxypeptidase